MRYGIILGLALLPLTACNRETPEQKAAADARAIAMVEAAQKVHPPVQPVAPQPVPPETRSVYRLSAQGCNFTPAGGGSVLLITGRAKAVLRIAGEPVILAADSGSHEIAPGAYTKYVGREHWAELARGPDGLTLHDRWDRVVYTAKGAFTCRG